MNSGIPSPSIHLKDSTDRFAGWFKLFCSTKSETSLKILVSILLEMEPTQAGIYRMQLCILWLFQALQA